VTGYQYYWYEIDDGFNYWVETESSSKIAGDSVGKVRFRDASVTRTLSKDSGGNWQYTIEKKGGGATEGVEVLPISSFPWPF
jgi:hypothetical protein